MKKANLNRDESLILDQAARWVVELNDGELSEARADVLHQWINQSPTHEAMLLKASDIWDEANSLAAEPVADTSQPRPFPIFTPGLAAAAMLLIAIAVFFSPLMTLNEKSPSMVSVDHQTIVGEFKTITLSDSSKVTLNTNSKISVAFNAQTKERRVYLVKGEAFFEVAKDSARPFIVDAGKREVRVIGTAFNVKLDDAYIEVVVDEGIVELASKAVESLNQNVASNRLYAGQAIEIDNGARELIELDSVKLKKRLSWQTGRIIFDGDQLKDVIAEVSRYTDTKFIFSNKETELIRVGGSFRIGNVADLLEAIEEGFDVQIKTEADGTKVIDSKVL